MKKSILLFFVVFAVFEWSWGQVAINTSGNNPDSSAMLDVSASDKGVLFPKVALTSTTDQSTVHSPATGLVVYNTSNSNGLTQGYYYWNGSSWVKFSAGASQDMSADQGSPYDPDKIEECNSSAQNHLFKNLNVRIPPSGDTGTTDYDMNISQPGSVCDIDVKIKLIHTYDGDLRISLISPSGTQVVLSNQNGGSENDYDTTTFDDEATDPISGGSAPFDGTYKPDEALSNFDGETISGTWTLRVEDLMVSDTGSIKKVKLIITGTSETPWEYVGESSVTYHQGQDVLSQAYYSAQVDDEASGCKIRLSRSGSSGSGDVGDVLGYAAQNVYAKNHGRWVSMHVVAKDDGTLSDNTTYYYKLWKACKNVSGKENYGIITQLVNQ